MDELKRELEEAALEHAKDVFGAQGEEVAGIIGQALGLNTHGKSSDDDKDNDDSDNGKEDSSDSDDDDKDNDDDK